MKRNLNVIMHTKTKLQNIFWLPVLLGSKLENADGISKLQNNILLCDQIYR